MPHGVAWAGDRPDGAEGARARLLDAAAVCVQRHGLERTGISDVAAQAGVTRRTVYRYFVSRDALVSAALVHQVGAFSRRAREKLASYDDPADMVVEGVLFALRELAREPVLGRVVVSGEPMLNEASLPVALDVFATTVTPLVEAAGWDEREIQECGEVIVRMALSLLAAPHPGRDEEGLRRFLQARLLPALGLARGSAHSR